MHRRAGTGPGASRASRCSPSASRARDSVDAAARAATGHGCRPSPSLPARRPSPARPAAGAVEKACGEWSRVRERLREGE